MLTDQQIIDKYGKPGIISNLTTIDLPYPMRIAWDLGVSVNRIQCHKLIAQNLLDVFNDLLDHYGLPELQELGIDLFGGCYNFRLMRGSKTKWSRHSWGIAIDLDPVRNGLKTKWVKAQFSKPEYQFMVDTFYKHGFMSLGRDEDRDAMHFEINQ
jgi:hypothetical protein